MHYLGVALVLRVPSVIVITCQIVSEQLGKVPAAARVVGFELFLQLAKEVDGTLHWQEKHNII